MSTWEDYLTNIYYDPSNPASFSGPDKLYRYVRKTGKYVLSKYKIRKWLQRQEPYSLQRPVRRSFKRNRIMVTGIDDQWSADLMDMVKFSKSNHGYTFVLVVIDVFSKYLWLRPLTDKKGQTVSEALGDILQEGRQPRRLRTDRGQEFKAKTVQTLLKKWYITHLLTNNETKAAVAERVLKTIKTRLYRYFTHKQSYEYVDHLQKFAASYNQTYHRTIGMAPSKVDKNKEIDIWWRMYWPNTTQSIMKARVSFRFKVGDRVRLSHLRNIFSREYDEKWTGEIFTISERYRRGGLPIYRVNDYDGDEIQGTFYQSELQAIDIREDDTWKVETTMKTRGRGLNKEHYVKWLNWPKKFNSWIKATDVKEL